MTASPSRSFSRTGVHLLVVVTGLASLSWEVLWQIESSLALGVSAWGTAITLAATMGGMSIGSILVSRALEDRLVERPVRLYGVLEFVIGLAGLSLGVAFHVLERIDTWVYAALPGLAWLVHLTGIVVVLGVPAVCMGATFPVFGLVARQFQTSIALLYALNTLGATIGVLLAAFVLIPSFGMTHAAWVIAGCNVAVGVATWMLGRGSGTRLERRTGKVLPSFDYRTEQWILLVTGFATLSLEIAWFRALTATFYSTTDAFAIMLSAMLLALGLSAIYVPHLRQRASLGSLLSWAGILILAATPVIERFGSIPTYHPQPFLLLLHWFLLTLSVIGPPVFALGVAFPWILDEQDSARKWGTLYAVNTLAAIAGALGAAWLLLPAIGFARTAWLTGALVTATGVLLSPAQKRLAWSVLGVAGLSIAVVFESGVGRTHIGGEFPGRILEFYEGPEANVAAVEYGGDKRALVIDGFGAASQFGGPDGVMQDGYMAWMGHLPMLLHPDPKSALVICFGTGQTANAVRNEAPETLDIIDINPRVIQLAHNFGANHDVLDDRRVTVMDGRAYMRRTTKRYDIITLEPMPPSFAGVNALYSREFYELASKSLTDHGVIAQWLPHHLVAAHYALSIAKTFRAVFPNSVLWLEPTSKTGILLGTKDDSVALGSVWPGFKRAKTELGLSESEIRRAVVLDRLKLQRYAVSGEVISDDNQLLAYGQAVHLVRTPPAQLNAQNMELLRRAAAPDTIDRPLDHDGS